MKTIDVEDIEGMMPTFSAFYAYDVETSKLYSHARDMSIDLNNFDMWLRGIVKHGGPKHDGELLYDEDTMERVRAYFIETMGEHLT